ncbi:MAG: DnaJ domain-containing protein [Nitrospirae bacterium]|nr:DnaJ domain-containing protein [Nitrospirota bacterium]
MSTDEKDKRRFRRYRRQSPFKLYIDGKVFDAKITDYSLDGIGAILKGTPLIANGTVVDVDMNTPDLHAKGKIIWTKRSDTGLVVGIRRLDFPKSGRLEDYPIADVLIGLQRVGAIGVLQIRSGDMIKKVYVKNGDIIFSISNQQDDRIGEFLFKTGVITVEQFDNYISTSEKTGRKEGAVLVELGYIKPQNLPEIVRRLSEEIILGLFSLKDGSFEFKEGMLPSDEVITLKLSAANIIYRGIKRISEPQKVFDFLQLSYDTVLCFSTDPLDLFQDIALDLKDRKILSYVDGKSSIKDIISMSPISETETLKTLYALMSTRIIEVMGDEELPAGLSAADVIEGPESRIDEDFVNKIEGIYSTYETIGYYGILGVKEWAATEEIKKAFYKVAKEFHPDRHFHLKSEELKGKLNTIFSYITAAYTTLSDPQKKRQYDSRLSQGTGRVSGNKDTAAMKFEEGRNEFKKGNYKEAFQLVGQAAYLDNTVADYHYYYGLVLSQLKRFKEAERSVSRALECSPYNAEYMTELGFVLLKLGFPHRAKSTFEKAMKTDPSNQRAVKGFQSIED